MQCIYGNENCWFNHNDHAICKENGNINKDVVQRMFSMMGKMTVRIVKMKMKTMKHKKIII